MNFFEQREQRQLSRAKLLDAGFDPFIAAQPFNSRDWRELCWAQWSPHVETTVFWMDRVGVWYPPDEVLCGLLDLHKPWDMKDPFEVFRRVGAEHKRFDEVLRVVQKGFLAEALERSDRYFERAKKRRAEEHWKLRIALLRKILRSKLHAKHVRDTLFRDGKMGALRREPLVRELCSKRRSLYRGAVEIALRCMSIGDEPEEEDLRSFVQVWVLRPKEQYRAPNGVLRNPRGELAEGWSVESDNRTLRDRAWFSAALQEMVKDSDWEPLKKQIGKVPWVRWLEGIRVGEEVLRTPRPSSGAYRGLAGELEGIRRIEDGHSWELPTGDLRVAATGPGGPKEIK